MKILLLDAIVGIGFPSDLLAVECEKVGLAIFSGNQHTREWTWVRSRLELLTETQLEELYSGLRDAREESKRTADVKANTSRIITGS